MFEAGEDVVAFGFEVLLERGFFGLDEFGVEEGDGGELEAVMGGLVDDVDFGVIRDT